MVAQRKIRMLDLFCGAGGAAMGYFQAFSEAGYEVEITGVDIVPQKNYPFAMRVGDAMTWPLRGYDFTHASPPCQDHTGVSNHAKAAGKEYGTGWMLAAMHKRLSSLRTPWIIENVNGAKMRNPVILCGTMFGLPLIRHRKFDSNYLLYPANACRHQGNEIGIFGHNVWKYDLPPKTPRKDGHKRSGTVPIAEGRLAMEIDWMTGLELDQAIPPAYTRWLGQQIAQVLTLKHVVKEVA